MLAAIVFAAASATDFVDGYLARSRNSVTNFGKLMDPLADKLLVVAALISLVSLHRLAAWVAMVIITRELAVTVLRMGASQAGVVIAASMSGKVKTCLQIATILVIIAVHGQTAVGERAAVHDRAGDRALGAGLLLRPAPADAAGAGSGRRLSGGAPVQPLLEAGLVGQPVSPRRSPRAARSSSPLRSATTLCWWIVSRFSWRASTKLASSSSPKRATTPAIISRTQSSTKRGRRWAFSTTSTSSERFISS